MNIFKKADIKAFPDKWRLPEDLDKETSYMKIGESLLAFVEKEKNNGCEGLAENIEILYIAVDSSLGRHNIDKPFQPKFQAFNGSRSYAFKDFERKDFIILEEFLNRTSNLAMLARINDMLWEKEKNRFEFGKEAINKYLSLCEMLREKNKEFDSFTIGNYVERSIMIWRSLGRKEDKREKIELQIKKFIDDKPVEPNDYTRYFFFELLPLVLRTGGENTEKWISLIEQSVEDSIKQKQFEKSRKYVDLLIEIYGNQKRTSEKKRWEKDHTKIFIMELEEVKKGGANALFLGDFYNKAIEACGRTPGMRQKRVELHKELVETQKNIPGQLNPFTFRAEIDVSKCMNACRNAIQSSSFIDSLRVIADMSRPQRKSILTENARNSMRANPVSTSMSNRLIGRNGRTTSVVPGSLSDNPDENALKYNIFEGLGIHMKVCSAIISGCRLEIERKSDFNINSIYSMLYPNPFVPEGHVEQFKSGILSGIRGDWISSCTILTLQLENSLRTLMEIAGEDITGMDVEGRQKEKSLSSFLFEPKMEGILGKDMQFQLDFLFCSEFGLNIRNDLAHGLLSDGELQFFGPYVWSLAMLLCFNFQQRFYNANIPPADTEESE